MMKGGETMGGDKMPTEREALRHDDAISIATIRETINRIEDADPATVAEVIQILRQKEKELISQLASR